MKILVKNKLINSILFLSLVLSFSNAKAFSVGDIINGPKKLFGKIFDACKEYPEFAAIAAFETLMVSAIIAFAVMEFRGNNRKRQAISDEIAQKCIMCGKLNQECSCDLLEKLNFAFLRYGSHETVKYFNDVYQGRFSKWLKNRIKSVILKMNDVNMRFEKDGYSFTLLHLACYHKHEEIVKWLIEEMFVDPNAIDSNGVSASQVFRKEVSDSKKKGVIVGENLDSSRDILFGEANGFLVECRIELQRDLLDKVANLENVLRRNKEIEKSLMSRLVKEKLSGIRKSIEAKEVPGFAKQLIIPELIKISKKFPDFVSENYIVWFYRYIAFNYTFLNDKKFVPAVEFAKNLEIKDMYGRTIDQAGEVYRQENKGIKCPNCDHFYETDFATTYEHTRYQVQIMPMFSPTIFNQFF